MGSGTAASGWAFLVARGRRQGHRARLVPDVLVELGLTSLVEEGRSAETPAGRVIVISRTHRIRPADIGTHQVRDERGRPFDIIYGLVCLDVPLGDIAEDDVATAFAQALAAYRRFIADESGFATEVSRPFPLRSAAARPPPAPGHLDAAARAEPRRPPPPPGRAPARWHLRLRHSLRRHLGRHLGRHLHRRLRRPKGS
ncbi:hypothetical protein WEI85_36655 [Actinomycetes bacterium KLBMP 9797]